MSSVSPQIRFADYVTLPDLVVFFSILTLTFAAAFLANRLRRTTAVGDVGMLDYLIMGRGLTLPLFVATLVSTWYGGIFGVTEIAFESGVYNFVTQGAFWYAAYLVFAFFLADRLRAYDAVTLPELAGRFFGPKSEKLAGVFNFFNILPVAYVISIGLFIQMIFGGTLLVCTAAGTVAIAFYSMWGGLRSVVFSDVVQFAVMCLSVLTVALFCAGKFGGIGFLRANLPATHFDATGGHSWAETLVWGFIAMETLVDPSFYQRCFAAKNPRTAKIGILISTAVWCGFDICTTLGGMYARAVIPTADPTRAYPVLAMQILPAGFRGFFLAGILATILSTLDSFLFVASNTVSYDLAPVRWRKSVAFGHASTLFSALAAVGVAAVFSGSIKDAWKTIGSYSAGCLLLPMMLGFLRPGWVSDRGFVLGTLLGAAGITYWCYAEHAGFFTNVDGLYVGLACTCAGLAIAKALKL
jgi:SSS family solute:Na+ symporter